MVLISRIENAVSNKSFLKRYFTENEIKLFDNKNKAETIAGNFAVKEAVSKCFGTGISGFSLHDIEVLRNELGKPFVTLSGNAEKLKNELNINKIHISITHEGEYALGFAIAEGD